MHISNINPEVPCRMCRMGPQGFLLHAVDLGSEETLHLQPVITMLCT